MMFHLGEGGKKKKKALLPEQLVHLVLLRFAEPHRAPSARPPSPQEPAPTHLHTNMSRELLAG